MAFGTPTTLHISKWLRRPRLRELARIGDYRQWLYVAEPERDLGIYGVWYRLSGTQEEIGGASVPEMHRQARAELFRRVRAGGDYAQREGSDGSAFVWIPTHAISLMELP